MSTRAKWQQSIKLKCDGYKIAFGVAVLLHIILLVLLLSHFSHSTQASLNPSEKNIIQAHVVSSSMPLVKQDKALQQPEKPLTQEKPQLIKQQPQQPQQQTVQDQQVVAKQAVVKAETETEAKKLKVKAVEAVKQQKLLEKQLLQKQLMEEQKQLQTEAKKASALSKQKKVAQEKQIKKLAAEALQQELQAEQKQLSASKSQQSIEMQGEVDKYKAMILQAIGQQWVVPDTSNRHLSCKLLIRLAPAGMVLKVDLIKSSGNDAFDRSAIVAVHRASPLPVPSDAAIFESFRELNLTVEPDGATPIAP